MEEEAAVVAGGLRRRWAEEEQNGERCTPGRPDLPTFPAAAPEASTSPRPMSGPALHTTFLGCKTSLILYPSPHYLLFAFEFTDVLYLPRGGPAYLLQEKWKKGALEKDNNNKACCQECKCSALS